MKTWEKTESEIRAGDLGLIMHDVNKVGRSRELSKLKMHGDRRLRSGLPFPHQLVLGITSL